MKLRFYDVDVADMKILEDQPQDFKTLYNIAVRLQEVVDGMNEEISIVGEEALGTFLRKTVFGFVNVLGHILNTFKTNVFKGFKDLKRSELRYYHESNVLSVSRLLRADFNVFSELDIDFPDKMSATYLETSTNIDKFLNYMDMPTRIKAIYKHTSNTLQSAMTTAEDRNQLGATLTAMDFKLIDLAKQFKTVDNCFKDTKHVKHKRFSKLFPKTGDVPATDTVLLKCEAHMQGVGKVYDDLTLIENEFEKLLEAIDKKTITDINKETMQVLAAYCTAIARMCDMYGVVMQDLQRVEHNFVMVLKTLRKKLDL
jgi:hypothetical protein